jgi:hypothetical protein
MTSDCAVYDDGILRITNTTDPPGLAIGAEIHFSLGGLRYCDLAGLRAIVCATGADSGDGRFNGRRTVVLHQVPPQLITVLRIVGWDSTPGLTLDLSGRGVPPVTACNAGNKQGSAVV